MSESSYCRAVLTRTADAEYSVSFELFNPTLATVRLATDDPFLDFQVRAAAGGAALAVEQPALDLPVHETSLTVPASGSLALGTPIRLRFGAPSNDGFVWSIAHAAPGVTLTFTLKLPAPYDQPFTVSL